MESGGGSGRRGGRLLDTLKEAVAGAVWLHGAAADRLGPGPLMIRELGPSLAALLRELHGADIRN